MADKLVRKCHVIETPEESHRVEVGASREGLTEVFNGEGLLVFGVINGFERSQGHTYVLVRRQAKNRYPLTVKWVSVEEEDDLLLEEMTDTKWWVQYRHKTNQKFSKVWQMDISCPPQGFGTAEAARERMAEDASEDHLREFRVIKITTTRRMELDNG